MTVVAVQEPPASSSTPCAQAHQSLAASGPLQPPYTDDAALDAHVQRSWDHFRTLGSPMWHVAPMVDQSELPFRMLCRAHGAQAAYTPMLHARLFLEKANYRQEHFSSCEGDRPLFVQFCANDPNVFVAAAKIVQDQADYIDLNLGCPQRIAKRGFYGSFLMDDMDLIQRLVLAAARQLTTPISCKIRLFPDLQQTIRYAQMLQTSGCSLLAVHGRTREMKDNSAHRADWDAIAAVRAAVRIPVLANGDVRCLSDARALMAHTKADGVMSAEPLLLDPALFSLQRPPEGRSNALQSFQLCKEYLEQASSYPTHIRMVKGHIHKLLSGWLAEFPDIRDTINREASTLGIAGLRELISEQLGVLIAATGRDHPIPKIPERKLRQLEAEAAKQAAIQEQEREAAALAALPGAAAAQQQQQQQGVEPLQQQQQLQQQAGDSLQQQEQQQLGKQAAAGAPAEEPAQKRQQTMSAEIAAPAGAD